MHIAVDNARTGISANVPSGKVAERINRTHPVPAPNNKIFGAMIMWKFKSVAPRVWGVSYVAIMALIGLGLAACGGGGSGSAASVSGGGSAPPAPPVVIPPPACVLPANPAITPSVSASRITGVAPLAVFFDASSTIATATSRPFHDLGYSWNFGESTGPGIAAWGVGARPAASRNLATGPLAAHVYETPGTYTVCVTITDGTNTVDGAVVITVTDPEVVFAGAATTCFSNSGDFTGCPAGAVQVTSSNFVTAISTAAPGKRLLFKRGDTWTVPVTPAASARLSANGPGIIGAFGVGAAPIVRPTAAPGNSILTLSGAATPNISDWRIMDFEFDGLSGSSSLGVAGGGGAQQITLLRLNIHDVKGAVTLSTSVLDFFNNNGDPGHTVYDQIAVVDSNFQRLNQGSGSGGMFFQARRVAALGNFVSDSTGGEHVVRAQYINKGVFFGNDFGFPAVAKHAFTLRADNVGLGGVTAPNNTAQVMIAGNVFRGGLAAQPVSIQPSATTEDQRISDIILEGNLLLAGPNSQNAIVVAADEVTLRNNSLNLTGATEYVCMMFQRLGAEPAHSELRIYNNSCYTNDAVAVAMRVVFLRTASNNITIKNNLGYAPNLTGPSSMLTNIAGSTGVVSTGNSSDLQIAGTSPLFTNGTGTFSSVADFSLNAGSYAINAGVVVPVFIDQLGAVRPQGAGYDIGATEQ